MPELPLIWKLMRRFNRWMIFLLRHEMGPRGFVLLLETTGRNTGLPRLTPLQFEVINGNYYVASARGVSADWYRNIQVEPLVNIHGPGNKYQVRAKTIEDPRTIADFLETRLERHPIMLRMIMCLFEGLPWNFNRSDLEKFAGEKALVILPAPGGNHDQTGSEEKI